MNSIQFQALMFLVSGISLSIAKSTTSLICFIIVSVLFFISYISQDKE